MVRTGSIEFVPDIPLALLEQHARDEEHLDILTNLGMRSYVCVPLLARGRIFGCLTLINAESRRSHDASDLQLAEDLAGRAALAIDNSRLYQKSVDAGRAKDEFLATLSHELKSPITAVLGHAQLLEAGGLDEGEYRSAIEAIKSSAKAQARLVEDILEVSRQVVGKMRIDTSPIDLAETVRGAADAITPAAKAKNIDLLVQLPAEPCLVVADPHRIQQVLWNLASNAVKFTPAGGQLRISVASEQASATIEVADTGVGISGDFLPFIFERFRQAPARRAEGGLGLGLSIVRHIVEVHGGTVEAASQGEGLGSTFTVRLPLMTERGVAAASRTLERRLE